MNFRQLPIYNIVVNPDDEETTMSVISLVDYPAVEHNYQCFREDKPLSFSIEDTEKHQIFGPAILADTPIYRRSADMGEYYVNFTKECIENIVIKYSKQQLWNTVSLQHSGQNIGGAVCVEFFIKDATKGLTPKGYEDCPDGSLFVTFKIEDDQLWDEIKNSGELNGYSVEIIADLELTEDVVDDGQEEDEFLDELIALLEELGIDYELFTDEKKKLFKVDWKLVDRAIDQDLEVEVKMPDKTVKGYIYSDYTKDGSKNIVVYDGEDWNIINETNISTIKPTGVKGGVNWGAAVKEPGFDWVQKQIDDAGDVRNIQPQPKNDYERAVLEHKIAMITYIDEVGKETGICVGNRQCGVFELGFTRAGNACMRVYQYFGPTHHTDDPIPAWRNLLYSRIRSFRIVDWLDPIEFAPIGFNETGPDKDGFQTTLRSDLRVG